MATRRRASRSSLTGAIGDVRRRLRYLEGRPSPSKLANQVVRRTNIQPRAVATDQIALRAITNSLIEENAIAQAQLQDNSVGKDEIIENSVGNSELDFDAVDSENIIEDAVDNDAVDIDAIENENVANDAIGNDELQTDAVDSPEIIQDGVGSDEIAPDAVGTDEIQLDAITNIELAPNSVSGENIQDGAVEDRHISNVTAEKLTTVVPLDKIPELPATRVTSEVFNRDRIPNLPASRITTGQFAVGRIPDLPASIITSGTFGTARIANLAITEDKLASESVTSSKVKDNSLSANDININNNGIIVNRGARATGPYLVGDYNERAFYWYVTANVGTGSGELAVGNHSHGGSSSVKFKKEISEYEINPQKILNLRLKKFKYKNSHRDIQEGWNRDWLHGYLVEDVMELGLEEVVTYDHHGEPDSIRYDMIGVLAVELIKQQQNEIDSLKEEIERLKDSL